MNAGVAEQVHRDRSALRPILNLADRIGNNVHLCDHVLAEQRVSDQAEPADHLCGLPGLIDCIAKPAVYALEYRIEHIRTAACRLVGREPRPFELIPRHVEFARESRGLVQRAGRARDAVLHAAAFSDQRLHPAPRTRARVPFITG